MRAADDDDLTPIARRAAIGALVGAVVGFLLGWLVHRLVSDDGSALTYELVGGGLGLVAGVALGAFYGGATSLDRHRPGPGRT